jgi:hypothetical protein
MTTHPNDDIRVQARHALLRIEICTDTSRVVHREQEWFTPEILCMVCSRYENDDLDRFVF